MQNRKSLISDIIKRTVRYFKISLDAIRGLDFLIVKEPEQIGYNRHVINRASPSGNGYLYKAIKDIGVTKNTKILDIGCAKGDALRVFTNFPFSNISGIEISYELSNIAKNNFRKMKKKVEIINADARTFTGYGDFNFFYLYNPFPNKEILSFVIKKILYYCTKCDIYILYNNPVHIEVFLNQGFTIKKKYDDEWNNGMLFLQRPAALHPDYSAENA
jgi:SAM-dependent methyltransferase